MKTLAIAFLLFYSVISFGQDVIILKNGDEIEAKVTEILSSEVKYKRATNITGPTYTLAKSKIFMIRYESGDKDIFDSMDASASKPAEKRSDISSPVNSNPSEFVFDPEIGDPYCQIKKQMGAKVYGDRANEIFYRQDMVFYGFDLTYLKLTNKAKIGDGVMIVPQYFEEWNDLLTNDYLPVKKISDWMSKPTLFVGSSVFPTYHDGDAQNFVSAVNYCITFEDLQKIVKNYVLREKEGIGMVVNLVNFNKEREYSLIYVTFFDIRTREIMFAAEVSGKAGGSGMGKHWASGVAVAFIDMFIDQIYKPQRTANYMIPNKLLFY